MTVSPIHHIGNSNSPSELVHTAFVELSTAHLLKKKFKILSFTEVEICAKQKLLQRYGYLYKEKNGTFFLIHRLHFKLHLMFNVNIPKDAARSGLPRYI
jgi:hypothetical protein